MANSNTTVELLQALHREVLALREERSENADFIAIAELLVPFQLELGKIWDRPERSQKQRDEVMTGKIRVNDTEYGVNAEFRDAILALSDEAEIGELEAAKILLDAQQDVPSLDRPLLQCGLIRFHQQRKWVLDTLRLLLELDRLSEEETSEALDAIKQFVDNIVFGVAPGSTTKRTPERCMEALNYIKALLRKVGDRLLAASTLGQAKLAEFAGEMQTMEFTRGSLYEQHELIGVILSRAIEKGHGQRADFTGLLDVLKKSEKYDALLIHLFPALAAYVTSYAYEGDWGRFAVARQLNDLICPKEGDQNWTLGYIHAAVRAWWLVEYSGFYVEEPPDTVVPATLNVEEEDKRKTRAFTESLKDGAFDFLLALAADTKSGMWQDPARIGMRHWLQRKAPALAPDWTRFSDFFQTCMMQHFESFVDAFISNLPDVLRRLRVEEDEQRQLSRTHEQDLDLERFLIIIAYTYEGRADAAVSFWSDPDSNLAGFMIWASRRASTPLVTAFCEMLQAISENENCANAAHEFLMDEGPHSSGKLRRSQSLTWNQIFRELVFFSNKIREKPVAVQNMMHRPGKPGGTDQAEAEPESAMMLECYLRLMTKLASESENSRQFLFRDSSPGIIELLFQLASSQIPARLRACVFTTLRALLARKTQEEGHFMWACLDAWMTGGYAPPVAGGHAGHHRGAVQYQQTPNSMEHIFEEIGNGFEEPHAFIELLTVLVMPPRDGSPLNDSLPFSEHLAASTRHPGIEAYVDFVLGHVFANKASELSDPGQLHMLRLACLDFTLTCLTSFNEDLIVLGNCTNISVDNSIATSDLVTYVQLHPFSRVMEWMFNAKVMTALFNATHQDTNEAGSAAPNSPLMLSVLRAVEVISRVLDLQATYAELVRPMIKLQTHQRRNPVANASYATLEDGLVTRLDLVVDLGIYCGFGHTDLTLASLKLLGKLSGSPRIASAWSTSSGLDRHGGRNKAIVALEADGEHGPIAQSLISELRAPVQMGDGEADAPAFLVKVFILDFLYACLKQTPRRPTIAHLLLGFKCGADVLGTEPDGAFDKQTSLFHALLRLLFDTPSQDETGGIRQWMISLRRRVISVLQILWTSPLSAPVVTEELRLNELFFHLLMREVVIQPHLLWEGMNVGDVSFPVTSGAAALVDFFSLRSCALDYMAMELCSVSQNRAPALKRRIFEALNGQVSGEGGEHVAVPTTFDLYDFQLPGNAWDLAPPRLEFYRDVELDGCREPDLQGRVIFNIERVKEVLLLRQAESRAAGALVAQQDLEMIDREEALIVDFLTAANFRTQVTTETIKVLRMWARLLLVMIESNDFKGTARTSFFLQALQAILPSLELYASDQPVEALELARLARILLFQLDLAPAAGGDSTSQAGGVVGNLVGERLNQLFQICLAALGKRAGDPELRAVYYSICFRYLMGMADPLAPLAAARHMTAIAVHAYGERLLTVVCDDACGGHLECQTTALILLSGLVNLSIQDNDGRVIESMNRLNFIGLLVDSLHSVLGDWIDVIETGATELRHYHNAKLALLLQLAQTRLGAQHIINANLFRSLHTSGLFAADPELIANPAKLESLEQLYSLLATMARIVSAAVVSRGSHNVVQGLRFLRENRTLVSNTLKRSAGVGPAVDGGLEDRIGDLAEAFMVLIAATGFLESEEKEVVGTHRKTAFLFH